MTFVVLVVMVIVATCCAVLKWCLTSRILYIISIILFLAIGCGPVPAWLLGYLQSAYDVKPMIEWDKRNAIVLLGAGTEKIVSTGLIEPGIFSYGRIVEAAILYNDCRKTEANCKIIVSGGDPQHNGSSEASVYKSTLIQIGVDATDIFLESDSKNTWQNAQFTSVMLRQYDANRVFLVSSSVHLRRSMLYFTHFGIDPIPVRADYLRVILSLLPLSYNLEIMDFTIHEYGGIARYHAYNALGWNTVRKPLGGI